MGQYPLFKTAYETSIISLTSQDAQRGPCFIYLRRRESLDQKSASLERISIASRSKEKVLAEFGVYRDLLRTKFTLTPGTDPSKKPFELRRQDGKSFEDEWQAQGWIEGMEVDFSRGRYGLLKVGTYKIEFLKRDSLFFVPSSDFKDPLESVLSLLQWHPLWSLWVPPHAGMQGNPAVSGFEGFSAGELKKKQPLAVKEGLWARFPGLSIPLDLTFHVVIGLYPSPSEGS